MSNELSLKEFIKETIKNIAEGIYQAKEELYDKHQNCIIAPSTVNGNYVANEQLIKFDIAVTTSKTNSKNATGKVGINVVNIAIDGNFENSKINSNRIQFEVPFYAQSLLKNQ